MKWKLLHLPPHTLRLALSCCIWNSFLKMLMKILLISSFLFVVSLHFSSCTLSSLVYVEFSSVYVEFSYRQQLSNPSLLDGHLEWGPDPHSPPSLVTMEEAVDLNSLSEKQKGTQSQLSSRFGMVRGVKNTLFFPSCPLQLVPVIAEGAKQSLLQIQSKLQPPTPSHMLMPWGPWMPRVPRMPWGH